MSCKYVFNMVLKTEKMTVKQTAEEQTAGRNAASEMLPLKCFQ